MRLRASDKLLALLVSVLTADSRRLDADRLCSPIFATVHWTGRVQFGVLFQRAFTLEELAGIAWSLHDPTDLDAGRPRRFEVVRSAPLGA